MVTKLLVYGVSLFPSINLQEDQVASVARQVSLVLIGAIILSSLKQLMSGVKRVCLVLRILGIFTRNSTLGAQSYQQKPWCFGDVVSVGSDHGMVNSRSGNGL